MRFLENGPSIPDDLLFARDEGRAVFFCGAGVSRARANLPDFFGLADDVIRRLGVAANHPICTILDEAREIDKRTGVNGLISADRIFGLLERDFLTSDIEAAVAMALQPLQDVDLSAHRLLLELSTTPEGKTRLVTTNFDRLFDACDNGLQIWQPPQLPDPSRQDELHGIVHLHGRANENYSGAECDGFILSSSDFGRAYLADGWATAFFREIIDRYVIVFIGYTADDPPVHYLLEALSKKSGQLKGVYAFQPGTSIEAAARWRHKGIEAIAYPEADRHRALWETLEAWARRARAPDDWYSSVIDLARKGPESLQPHERGQVAHVVSKIEGARKFAEANPPPPADWLCVFDVQRRYAHPQNSGRLGEAGSFIDPFELYGLDSDPVPKKIHEDDDHAQRAIPATAWDAFTPNRLDRLDLGDASFSAFRGHWAATFPALPSRLYQLGRWIAGVADQPASVWWASHQDALHPHVRRVIGSCVQGSRNDESRVIRRAWRYLFEAWEERKGDRNNDWYELKMAIGDDGWDGATVKKYFLISRPRLTISSNYWCGPKPPILQGDELRNLLSLDVEYQKPLLEVTFPDELLTMAVREHRKNLERALELEIELGGYGLSVISSIEPDDKPDGDDFERTHGLSGSVISFAALFTRLIKANISAARREFAAWPEDDETIFSRLRIWGCGKAELVTAHACGSILGRLNDNVFWASDHQRDLLLVLARRWRTLSSRNRGKIERRIIEGPPRWPEEEDAHFEERRAWASLSRLTWLADNNCDFSFDLSVEMKRLKDKAPNWKSEYAAQVCISTTGRCGWVRTATEYDQLLKEPLSSTLIKALELSGRSDDFLVRKEPFAGLSNERGVRAFAALMNAAKRNEYPRWAWNTFLNAEARKNDKPRLSALIAERMTQIPDEDLKDIIHPASGWILNASSSLSHYCDTTFDKTIIKLFYVLLKYPQCGKSALIRKSGEPDWTMEALNAPVGNIARALFNDPRTNGLKAKEGFPVAWLTLAERLISLPDDLRRHGFVVFAYHLDWFYVIDPKWTEKNLLSALNVEDRRDHDAVLSGFFWGSKTPGLELCIRIKPFLLSAARERKLSKHGYGETIAGIILAGWGTKNIETGKRCVSDEEMREVLLHADDEFRSSILWHAKRWSEEENTDNRWRELLFELLRDAWPRQKAAKTPIVSARLCELAFSRMDDFPKMVESILPLLTVADGAHLLLYSPEGAEYLFIERYPSLVLALLYAVLPVKAQGWPYNVEKLIMKIDEADSALKFDARLLELKRRWNAR